MYMLFLLYFALVNQSSFYLLLWGNRGALKVLANGRVLGETIKQSNYASKMINDIFKFSERKTKRISVYFAQKASSLPNNYPII